MDGIYRKINKEKKKQRFQKMMSDGKEWTSNSSNSMSGCKSGWAEEISPALCIWSLKKQSFRDISAHLFTYEITAVYIILPKTNISKYWFCINFINQGNLDDISQKSGT